MSRIMSRIPWYEIVASVVGLVMVVGILWLSKPQSDHSVTAAGCLAGETVIEHYGLAAQVYACANGRLVLDEKATATANKLELADPCQCHQMCDPHGHGCAAARCVTRDGVPPARPANGWGQ